MIQPKDKVAHRMQCAAIHKKALLVVKDLKLKEAELIRVLQEMDRTHAHRMIGYNSLYQYCLKALELTENQACDYIRVARKAMEISDLQKDINNGTLSVSKARRIVSVADAKNYREWSHKAKSCSKRELEKAIATNNPRLTVPEHCRYVGPDTLHFQAPLTERVFKKLQRAQEVLSQKQRQYTKMNELLDEVLEVYLEKYDPQRKAERALHKKEKLEQGLSLSKGRLTPALTRVTQLEDKSQPEDKIDLPGPGQVNPPRLTPQLTSDEKFKSQISLPEMKSQQIPNQKPNCGTESQLKPQPILPKKTSCSRSQSQLNVQRHLNKRSDAQVRAFVLNSQKIVSKKTNQRYIPAHVKHVVLHRDKHQCQWRHKDGGVCGEKKFLEIHHRKPVALGGRSEVSNLTVLCSGHHKALHEKF